MTKLNNSVKFQSIDTTRLGIYTPEDLAKARTQMMFPIQRERILTQIVEMVTQGGSTMADFELLLPMDHFKKIH